MNSKTHSNLRVLVYSGDDSVCGTIGTQRWIYDLEFPTKVLWDTWYDQEGQTDGFVTKFKTPFGKKVVFHLSHYIMLVMKCQHTREKMP